MNQAIVRQLLLALTAFFFLVGALSSAEAAKSRRSVKRSKPLLATGERGLVEEWEPSNQLRAHKLNYLLIAARTRPVNNQPTSPNPINQVQTPYNLEDRDIKFQISVKHDLFELGSFGALWFSYTQRSFWQFYDRANSQPFRETNYEPEFIYTLRPSKFSILNLGVSHESNGESNPRSRSWNRVYVQPAIELGSGTDFRVALFMRWWQRIKEDPATDENSDILDYMGTRDVELRLLQDGGWEVSLLGRKKAVQVDIAAPISSWLFLGPTDDPHINFHVQYFRGYGESLLDYNHFHESWGVGLSFPIN